MNRVIKSVPVDASVGHFGGDGFEKECDLNVDPALQAVEPIINVAQRRFSQKSRRSASCLYPKSVHNVAAFLMIDHVEVYHVYHEKEPFQLVRVEMRSNQSHTYVCSIPM
ncbi:DDB1- and CUL4-associated factor 12-like protein [Anopheles sinensis]|uniref:DDB1-and CUL4-associated factor 12-like protein n=1 Tax=Anopheles sinensis TaxID=74873 RepID=A0A084W6S3_ANOSI|nr:DDB1- and CUL4-associated factor 12-like protein [Anopheles sinensis]